MWNDIEMIQQHLIHVTAVKEHNSIFDSRAG